MEETDELRKKIREIAEEYVRPADVYTLTGEMAHIALKYGKAKLGLGVFVGFILGILLAAWVG